MSDLVCQLRGTEPTVHGQMRRLGTHLAEVVECGRALDLSVRAFSGCEPLIVDPINPLDIARRDARLCRVYAFSHVAVACAHDRLYDQNDRRRSRQMRATLYAAIAGRLLRLATPSALVVWLSTFGLPQDQASLVTVSGLLASHWEALSGWNYESANGTLALPQFLERQLPGVVRYWCDGELLRSSSQVAELGRRIAVADVSAIGRRLRLALTDLPKMSPALLESACARLTDDQVVSLAGCDPRFLARHF